MFRLIIFIIFLSSSVFAQGEIPSYLELKLHTELSEIKSNLESDITTRSIGSNIYKTNAPKTAIILTPSNKIDDKSIFRIKKETPKPVTRTEIDNKAIRIEALTWL